MADVMPFLRNVTRGRGVPERRLQVVAKHYEIFDGVSPINGQNRALVAALEELFQEKGPNLPVYFGNRNWHPFVSDTLGTMIEDGVKRALVFVTSGFSSYSSCRQYLEDLESARALYGDKAPALEKLRVLREHEESRTRVRVEQEEWARRVSSSAASAPRKVRRTLPSPPPLPRRGRKRRRQRRHLLSCLPSPGGVARHTAATECPRAPSTH